MAGPMAEAQGWIEACTGTPFDKEFAEYLKDGPALCELANAVEPGAIPKINRSALAFKQMENISLFTRWARSSLGLKEADLFDTVARLMDAKRGIFLLGYERRNVPMDYVMEVAQERGIELKETLVPGHLFAFGAAAAGGAKRQ